GLARQAPLFHAYLRWRIGYLAKVCEGREIRVPGGREQVETALQEPATALILLVDAPAAKPRGSFLRVREHQLSVDPGGLGLVVAAGASAAFFSMVWDEAAGRRVIEVSDAGILPSREEALERVEAMLGEALDRHSAQWQLWQTALPVLSEAD
ncbi:MAG: hypothetical protein AAGH19_12830, partial [Pseudomonadota bacterium]